MNLEDICNKITGLMKKSRAPLSLIPASLMACSVFKRPGLSAMMIASNIIRRQSEYGADAGPNEDGSQNMMNSLIYTITDEIVKAIKMDSVTQVVIPKGSMVMTGTGANAGGPVQVVVTNPTDITGVGMTR